MRNIELRTTNKFGVTNTEKFNGRKLTRYVAKEAAERNIIESHVIREFVENHFIEYYSNKEINSFEFTWLDEFNHRHKIVQYDTEIVNKEIFTRVQRTSDRKYNYTTYTYTNAQYQYKELFNEWYEFVGIFYEGFARVEREERGEYLCNFITKDGKILSEEWFMWVDDFKDGIARVKRTNGEQAKIDKTGKIVIK